ncbi:(Csu525(RpL17)), mRNA [Zea mays]|uniref:(Csu525(RpL17)), mRNA n=1 Tax=Zea mays TaxID=4577 RepID=A0A1D6QB07_MAIZE|nr:(Csu525(RpL17)), mRNA [Zea mays]
MGWAHPAVTMEEVLRLVRGFVDVLVLAGGRTSSGAAATWSADEIKKALRWALFFEEIFKDLLDSGQYEDSARELDAALLELTSSPEFPKGLAAVRSDLLSMARVLVMRHFLKPNTMSVENFCALLEAVAGMDIDGICASGAHNACQEYAESILNMNTSCFAQTMNACDGGLPTSSYDLRAESTGHSWIIVKEFQKTLDSASCGRLADRGLETFLNSVKRNILENGSNKPCVPAIPKTSQMIDEFLMWKQWRAKCLSYLLDQRTIRVLSGASLIFKAPKEQWMKVFEPLKSIEETCHSGLVETMEKDILDYARQTLERKPSVLWLLPPVLTAAAIPPQSSLFQIYLAQIDKQIHEAAPADRKCSCRGDEIDRHVNCEITERIQCLYAFLIQQLSYNGSTRLH